LCTAPQQVEADTVHEDDNGDYCDEDDGDEEAEEGAFVLTAATCLLLDIAHYEVALKGLDPQVRKRRLQCAAASRN